MTPSFAIIVEWENARFAELERTRAMLRVVRCQLEAVHAREPVAAEMILLFNEFAIDRKVVEQTVAECFTPTQVPARVEIVPTKGFNYYQQKNYGATLTRAEIVILLDCDVIPEENWLVSILAPFADPKIDIVAGETYVELESWYSRAFALFWFFPLRDPGDGLVRGAAFHANNVALRRAFFLAHPWPECEGYRAQGDVMMDRLNAADIAIWVQKKARAAHPVPLGPRYFAARALHHGSDRYIRRQITKRPNRALTLKECYWSYRTDLAELRQNVWPRRRAVGLSAAGAAFAGGVGFVYMTLKALGLVSARYFPTLLPRLFPI